MSRPHGDGARPTTRFKVQNTAFEATPLFIDGVLYTSTSFSQVAAINASSGTTLWQFDPQTYRYAPQQRLFAPWCVLPRKPCGQTIHMPTGDGRLIALDAISGEQEPIMIPGSALSIYCKTFRASTFQACNCPMPMTNPMRPTLPKLSVRLATVHPDHV